MSESSAGAGVRFTLGSAVDDEALFEVLAGIAASFLRDLDGRSSIVVATHDRQEARDALTTAGFSISAEENEPPCDWVSYAAALRTPVTVGRYLLDPHDYAVPAKTDNARRLYLPAARAFGTGSHESTRLALRLLQESSLRGRRVLDIGCGAGTLALVAACEGAALTVAFDLDPEAAFATRENARSNRIPSVHTFVGPIGALLPGGPGLLFDTIVANMLQEEIEPILAEIARLFADGGTLITSGQLSAREDEWLERLEGCGFQPRRLVHEGEWLGAQSILAR